MTSKFKIIFAMLCMAFTNVAFAVNAAPFGVELGVATSAQVKQQVGAKARLSDGGINKLSGGKVLESNGDGLGVEGLSYVAFTFDGADKLVAVVMRLPKESFKKTLSTLSGKYKLVEKEVPFVGDASATLQQGESVIDLNAPHMSFEMTVVYTTKAMKQAAAQNFRNERAAKDKRQADMF